MLKHGEVLFLHNESEFLLTIPSGILAVVCVGRVMSNSK